MTTASLRILHSAREAAAGAIDLALLRVPAAGVLAHALCGRRDGPAPRHLSLVRTPVVLVHGFGGAKSHWFAIERALRDTGFSSIYAMKYSALTSDIPQLAAELADLVRSVVAETGAERVHLVGHSLGGVIIRYAISVLGVGPLVDTAITVASPHGGSPLARFGAGATASQLRPGSAVLRQIEAAARPGSTRWVAYHSNLDAVVPAKRAMIRPAALDATNLPIENEGHLSILMSRRLARSVVEELLTVHDASSALAA